MVAKTRYYARTTIRLTNKATPGRILVALLLPVCIWTTFTRLSFDNIINLYTFAAPLFQIWAEKSGLSFRFVGGPGKTANDANVLIIHDTIPEKDDPDVLGVAFDPDNKRDPKSSILRMSTLIKWKPCYSSAPIKGYLSVIFYYIWDQ